MRIFITTILPEELIAENHLSQAACNFSRNLISGGGFDIVYSTLPPFVHSDLSNVNDNNFEIIYSSLHCKGSFFTKLAVIHDQCLLFRRIPRKTSVWLYNLCQMNFFLVILLKLFKPSVKVNVIELDFTPSPKFSLLGLCLCLINRADSMICLADSPLFTNKNKVCIPGVVPNSKSLPHLQSINKSFLLAGEMDEHISSLSKVLPVFADTPECILHISGRISDDSIIHKYTEYYPNIIFHGFLPMDEYLNLLHSVTYILSAREPNYPDNSLNFPSKIIEGLTHNRAIISTIAYPQLEDLKYFKINLDNFHSELKRIIHMDNSELMEYCNQGLKTFKLFSASRWFEIMDSLENKVC